VRACALPPIRQTSQLRQQLQAEREELQRRAEAAERAAQTNEQRLQESAQALQSLRKRQDEARLASATAVRELQAGLDNSRGEEEHVRQLLAQVGAVCVRPHRHRQSRATQEQSRAAALQGELARLQQAVPASDAIASRLRSEVTALAHELEESKVRALPLGKRRGVCAPHAPLSCAQVAAGESARQAAMLQQQVIVLNKQIETMQRLHAGRVKRLEDDVRAPLPPSACGHARRRRSSSQVVVKISTIDDLQVRARPLQAVHLTCALPTAPLL
jgi:hypothetical protein